MRILLTGSQGFIGTHVRRLLVERGHVVDGVDCRDPQVHGHTDPRRNGLRYKVDGGYEFISTVTNAAAQYGWPYEAVIHLAAAVGVGQSQYRPAHYVDVNALETARLWERIIAEKTVKRVVVASSMSIYGEGSYRHYENGGLRRRIDMGWDAFELYNPPNGESVGCLARRDQNNMEQALTLTPVMTAETKRIEPQSVYAMSKYDTEMYSLILGRAYDIPTTALRFFNVAGPGQALANPYTGVLAGFACRVLNGQPPIVFEDGRQSRDFINVEDVARAVVAAVEAPDRPGAYNICTGRATSVVDLAEKWCRLARDRGFPAVEPRVTGQFRKGDVRHCIGDPSAFMRDFGWEAQVDVDRTLEQLANWIIQNGLHENLPADKSDKAIEELQRSGLLA